MATRHPNYRLVKIHRNYTVEEVSRLLGVHRNTVREWLRRGLPRCDDKRPTLILGLDLAAFLQARRLKNKRPCQPGEIYCVRCRAPVKPAGAMAEFQPGPHGLGCLIGICPTCDSMIYRRVNAKKLAQVQGNLEVTVARGGLQISNSPEPLVNSDLGRQERDGGKNANA